MLLGLLGLPLAYRIFSGNFEPQAGVAASRPPTMKLPYFLAEVFDHNLELLQPVMQKKFHELRQATRAIPTWDQRTLNLFQKTYSHKNRYVNRLPYEAHRVRLDPGRNPEGCDYINASHLAFGSGDSLSYIAAQAPLPRTFGDFWQMVSEQDVGVIVMLVVADGLKCDRYWPEREGESVLPNGIKVEYKRVLLQTKNSIAKEFLLTDSKGSRLVHHYNFISWPDHDVPDSPDPLLRLITRLSEDPLYKGSVLVHCSAGVGRTGTFCVLDTLLRMIDWRSCFYVPGYDPVLDVTLKFREQRISIVETYSQFCFIYQLLLEHYRSIHDI